MEKFTKWAYQQTEYCKKNKKLVGRQISRNYQV